MIVHFYSYIMWLFWRYRNSHVKEARAVHCSPPLSFLAFLEDLRADVPAIRAHSCFQIVERPMESHRNYDSQWMLPIA